MRVWKTDDSAVENLGDVGMVHHGQGLAFGLKASDNLFAIHAELDDFQGHPPAHGGLLFGHIDNTAAAFADLLEQLVTADDHAGAFFLRRKAQGAGRRTQGGKRKGG